MVTDIVYSAKIAKLRPLMRAGHGVYHFHGQFKGIINQYIGAEASELLTEPVVSSEALKGEIDAIWISKTIKHAVPLTSLTEEEQDTARRQLAQHVEKILSLADMLKSSEDANLRQMGEFLPLALEVPGPEYIYVDKNNAVCLVCWGFKLSDTKKGEFKLIKILEGVNAAADVNKEPLSEEKEATAATEPEPPVYEESVPPVFTSENQPPKRRKIWPYVVLFAAVLLILLLGLKLLNHKPIMTKTPKPPVKASEPTPTAEVLLSFKVKVVDNDTREAIHGAVVTVGYKNKIDNVTTNQTGEALLKNMPKGTEVSVVAVANEYEERRQYINCCSDVEMGLKRLDRGGSYGKTGIIQIHLEWKTCDDLDLHVIDPCGQEIYFSQKNSTCQGVTGTLDHDSMPSSSNTSSCTNPQENIFWDSENVPPGKYQVFVQKYRQANPGEGTDFTVTVIKGNKRENFTDNLIKEKDNVTITEFEVQR
ncbi:MAG: hypothetical protein H7844_11920 [Nitrospirae bacterium YQR-1]